MFLNIWKGCIWRRKLHKKIYDIFDNFRICEKGILKNSSVSAATYVLCIRQLKKYFYPFKAHFESLGKMDTSNMTTYLVAGIDF